MKETQPTPPYQCQEVIKPERRPEIFGPEILSTSNIQVAHTHDLIKYDMEKSEINRRRDWPAIMAERIGPEISYLGEKNTVGASEVDKDMIKAFWGMGEFFRQIPIRRRLKRERQLAKERNHFDEIKNIDEEFNNLNIPICRWQNCVINTIFALRKDATGREFLKYFWETFDGLEEISLADDEDLASEKQGILGVVAAIDMFEKNGFEVYLPYPDQDAIEKIDLWIKKDNLILATQIKSKTNSYILSGYIIKSKVGLDGMTESEATQAQQANKLLTSAQKYDKMWDSEGVRVLPFWLDVPGSSDLSQDPVTGKLGDSQWQKSFEKIIFQFEAQKGGGDG